MIKKKSSNQANPQNQGSDKWEIKKLREVCRLINGKAYSKKELLQTGKYRVLRVGNFFTNNNWHYSDLELPNEKYCNKGDLLYAWSASFGPRIWEEEKVIYHYHIWKVAFDKVIIDKMFLYHWFNWDVDQIKKEQGTGTTMVHVSMKSMNARLIPIPPLPEQKRIVAILDRAFEAIGKSKNIAEQNLNNAKELFESYLNRIFEEKGDDWEEKKLGEVVQKTETINPKLETEKEFIYIDVSSVNKETKIIENTTVLFGKDAPSRARKLVKTNDLIFATVRPTHQRVAIISANFNNQVCSTGYYVLRAKECINHKIIYYFILTYNFNEEMEKLQKGASYPAVTNKEVETRVIYFPKSTQEQKRIVAQLDALQAETKKLETIYQQKLDNLEEMKKSVLQKAFNGEL